MIRQITGNWMKTFCPMFDKQSQTVDRIVCELLLLSAVCNGPLSTPSHNSTAAYIQTHRNYLLQLLQLNIRVRI